MKTILLVTAIVGIILASVVLATSVIIPSIQKTDPNYVKNKIAELEKMPVTS